MNDVVIVVPIYKNDFDEFEKISLKQLFKILYKYPIDFVMPDGLQVNLDFAEFSNCNIGFEYFDKNYFKSKADYSRLCLSAEFYSRFIKYNFMLIYQTDAFVFSDRLQEFVDAGYDYIGAPQNNDGFKEFHVGNGGLSLRKIKKAIEVLNNKEKLLARLPDELARHYLEWEDNFWGYCGHKKIMGFSVPDVSVAADFSTMDNSMNTYYQLIEKGLPFGLHGWSYCDYDFWKPIIECIGYDLPYSNIAYNEFAKNYLQRLREWYDLMSESDKAEICMISQLSRDKKYTVWGNGKYGRKVVTYLKKIGIVVDLILDINSDNHKDYSNISVMYPSEDLVKKNKQIIVAIKDGYEEIKANVSKIFGSESIELIDVFFLIDAYEKAFCKCNPKYDVYGIQEKLLIDFTNKI